MPYHSRIFIVNLHIHPHLTHTHTHRKESEREKKTVCGKKHEKIPIFGRVVLTNQCDYPNWNEARKHDVTMCACFNFFRTFCGPFDLYLRFAHSLHFDSFMCVFLTLNEFILHMFFFFNELSWMNFLTKDLFLKKKWTNKSDEWGFSIYG